MVLAFSLTMTTFRTVWPQNSAETIWYYILWLALIKYDGMFYLLIQQKSMFFFVSMLLLFIQSTNINHFNQITIVLLSYICQFIFELSAFCDSKDLIRNKCTNTCNKHNWTSNQLRLFLPFFYKSQTYWGKYMCIHF